MMGKEATYSPRSIKDCGGADPVKINVFIPKAATVNKKPSSTRATVDFVNIDASQMSIFKNSDSKIFGEVFGSKKLNPIETQTDLNLHPDGANSSL